MLDFLPVVLDPPCDGSDQDPAPPVVIEGTAAAISPTVCVIDMGLLLYYVNRANCKNHSVLSEIGKTLLYYFYEQKSSCII